MPWYVKYIITKLIQRQIVINGRRPDLLFSDSLSRHLLVEIQKGRLDEGHVQRHFYYYYDYHAKFPQTYPRLMFLANRVIPQHKAFLDEHGYEFREYPETDFQRRAEECAARGHFQLEIEERETPGVLPPRFPEIIYKIDRQEMTLCYKMLLLVEMTELADDQGRVPLRTLAERFKFFFVQRKLHGKTEENPRRFRGTRLSDRSIPEWQRIIRNQPVRYLTADFVLDEGNAIRWSPRIWKQWSPLFKEQLRAAAFDRLVRYFNRHVPGGY